MDAAGASLAPEDAPGTARYPQEPGELQRGRFSGPGWLLSAERLFAHCRVKHRAEPGSGRGFVVGVDVDGLGDACVVVAHEDGEIDCGDAVVCDDRGEGVAEIMGCELDLAGPVQACCCGCPLEAAPGDVSILERAAGLRTEDEVLVL